MKMPIKIYSSGYSTTNSGGKTKGSEVLLANDWADVSFGGGSKYNNEQGTGEEDKIQFTIDYRPSLAITQKCEVEFRGLRYTIVSIVNENSRDLKYIIDTQAKQ